MGTAIEIDDSSTAAALDRAFITALIKVGLVDAITKMYKSNVKFVEAYMKQVKEVVELPTGGFRLTSRLRNKTIATLLIQLKHDYSVVSPGFDELLLTRDLLIEASERTGLEILRLISFLRQNDHAFIEFHREALEQLIKLVEASLRNDKRLQDIARDVWEKLHANLNRLCEYAEASVAFEASHSFPIRRHSDDLVPFS